MTSARRRLIADELRVDFKVSQRRVSRALGLARSNLRYTPVVSDEQAALARRIEVLAGLHPRYDYRRIWALLDREGWSVIKKTVRRHWRRLGSKMSKQRANPRPRRPHGQDANACHLQPSLGKDDVWTWDFLFDRTSNGRSLKWLSLVDEYTRECLGTDHAGLPVQIQLRPERVNRLQVRAAGPQQLAHAHRLGPTCRSVRRSPR